MNATCSSEFLLKLLAIKNYIEALRISVARVATLNVNMDWMRYKLDQLTVAYEYGVFSAVKIICYNVIIRFLLLIWRFYSSSTVTLILIFHIYRNPDCIFCEMRREACDQWKVAAVSVGHICVYGTFPWRADFPLSLNWMAWYLTIIYHLIILSIDGLQDAVGFK